MTPDNCGCSPLLLGESSHRPGTDLICGEFDLGLRKHLLAIKRIDDNTAEATLKKAGKVVRNAKRVISKKGKVMTITMSGTKEKGEKIKMVAVYDKE